MCKNLVENGDLGKPLLIFNRTQKRATDLSAQLPSGKSIVAQSIDDAVSQADIVFTCVGDDRAVIDTFDKATKTDVRSKLFVDCSTVHPDTTRTLESTISGKGADFVACPVFGRPSPSS